MAEGSERLGQDLFAAFGGGEVFHNRHRAAAVFYDLRHRGLRRGAVRPDHCHCRAGPGQRGGDRITDPLCAT